MKKRIIFTITLMLLLGLPAFAHEDWGFSTETIWHWDCKPASINPIPIKMNVVMWADVYFADKDNEELLLLQTEGATYEGCIGLKVCVNFPNLKVKAAYTKERDIAEHYYISLVPTGDAPVYNENETSLLINTIHLTGNNLPVTLCVKATEVDHQAIPLGGSASEVVKIGQVNLTLIPTGTP